MVSCGFFERSCYVLTFFVAFMLVFLMFIWLCPFFKNQIVFVISLSFDFFLCFIISFLDFIIVFKRINYPVLNWVNPVWVPLVFFS